MFRKILGSLSFLLFSTAAQAQYAQDIEDQFKHGCSHRGAIRGSLLEDCAQTARGLMWEKYGKAAYAYDDDDTVPQSVLADAWRVAVKARDQVRSEEHLYRQSGGERVTFSSYEDSYSYQPVKQVSGGGYRTPAQRPEAVYQPPPRPVYQPPVYQPVYQPTPTVTPMPMMPMWRPMGR